MRRKENDLKPLGGGADSVENGSAGGGTRSAYWDGRKKTMDHFTAPKWSLTVAGDERVRGAAGGGTAHSPQGGKEAGGLWWCSRGVTGGGGKPGGEKGLMRGTSSAKVGGGHPGEERLIGRLAGARTEA